MRDQLVSLLKYLPTDPEANDFILPRGGESSLQIDETGLPIPPPHLLEGYAVSAESYTIAGKHHIPAMLDALAANGMPLRKGAKILDFGCGVGRLIRWLGEYADSGEVWGVDISAPHIHWCKRHLSPKFRFATTTLIPHLPFPDEHFDFIYAGSVFTHIEDIADAWLLELKRVLKPSGRAFLTYHDESTLAAFRPGQPFAATPLAELLNNHPLYIASGGEFDMLTLGRDSLSQVFYSNEFVQLSLKNAGWRIIDTLPVVWGYQTGYLVNPLTR